MEATTDAYTSLSPECCHPKVRKDKMTAVAGYSIISIAQSVHRPGLPRKANPNNNRPNIAENKTNQPEPPPLKSQPFSRSYGSVLPTSLTYIILCNQRLFTLETCCGYGYGLSRNLFCWKLSQIFKGRQWSSGRAKNRHALHLFLPYRRASRFQGGIIDLQRKENSSRVHRRRL